MPGNASAFLREASLTCKLRRHAKVYINAPSLGARGGGDVKALRRRAPAGSDQSNEVKEGSAFKRVRGGSSARSA